MAPKVAKRAREEDEVKAEEAKKAKEAEPEAKKEEEAKKEAEPKEEKFAEADAPKDNRSALKDNIHFGTASTTLNIVQTLGGKLLTTLQEGGMSCFLAGARANVAQKAGRYMFEAKVVQVVEQQGGKHNKSYLRIGFSTSSSSLVLGDEGSVCFDSEGVFQAGKKKQNVKNGRITGHQVVALVLNLDSKSPNNNTIALYRDGAAVGEPMPVPEDLKGKPLFPHVTFRNVSVATNFGPNAFKELPFKCRLLGVAAASDCIVEASKEPKDGKYEVMIPVGFPDEGTFDWLDTFLEKNPHYVELSDRKIVKWAHESGIQESGKGASNDKPSLQFGFPGQDATSLRRVISSLSPMVPRNYLIMEVKSNLLADERQQVLKRFNYPCYKKVAHVVMGEPPKEYKEVVQNKILKEKQRKADVAWRAKKAEATRKKLVLQRQEEAKKRKEELDKKRKAAIEEAKKKREAEKAKKDGAEEKKEDEGEEKKEEETKEDETMEEKKEEPAAVEEEEETEPTPVELDEEEKKVFFAAKTTPDLAPNVVNASFSKFTTPELDEGFDDIRYEWSKGAKAAAYLKKWVTEKKLVTRIDDIKPGQAFKEKKAEFDKLLKEWKEHKFEKTEKEVDGDLDIFSVTDILDVGKGVPLFDQFEPEDWELAKLRFDFGMLMWAFKKDTDDADRVGIPMDHVAFYFQRYYTRGFNPKAYGVTSLADAFLLIRDTAQVKDGLVISQLTSDMDNLDVFVKLTEEARRERCRRIDAGDETARLKFTAPKPVVNKAVSGVPAKPAPAAGKLGATPAPKASATKK